MNKVKEKRHWTPHSKGLTGPVLPVRFATPPRGQSDRLTDLQLRARYETTHYRVEHKGKGPAVSPGDIVRRLVDEYFDRVSPLPDDSIGAVIREQLAREEGRTPRRTAKPKRRS